MKNSDSGDAGVRKPGRADTRFERNPSNLSIEPFGEPTVGDGATSGADPCWLRRKSRATSSIVAADIVFLEAAKAISKALSQMMFIIRGIPLECMAIFSTAEAWNRSLREYPTALSLADMYSPTLLLGSGSSRQRSATRCFSCRSSG